MKDNLKEEILNLLKNGRAMEFLDICKELNYSREMDERIVEALTELVNDYELTISNRGKYMLFSDNEKNRNIVKGIFLDTKGTSGFVKVDGMEDVYIHSSKRMGAIEGDTVLVNLTKKACDDKKAEGEVVKIVKREVSNKVGEIYHFKKRIMVALDDKKYKKLIYLDNTPATKRLVDGDKVVVSFSGNEHDKDYIKANLVKRIGHVNDPGIDILSIIYDHDIEINFSEEALKELETIPTEVKESDINKIKNIKDLRNKMIFTIDGDDTKDIDDAISCEKLPNGNYRLGVHIAHVSYYIKENSHLDLEARSRGTSVYLVDRVIPMFPHQISNGICSLNPNEDRLTLTCDMEITPKGKLVNYEIYQSVIRSRKQMTYKKVNEILEKGKVPDGYEDYAETLKLMQELAHIIREDRTKRGAIDFDTDEPKILVDENCIPYAVTLREKGEGERLIEDFMLRANETIASHLFYMNLPCDYRVHGEPKEERFNKFLKIIKALEIKVNEKLKYMNPKDIQKLIYELKKSDAYKVLVNKLLSTMDKAIYSPENIGHWALVIMIYCHFTSPIRRYPDLMIHRLLDEFFFSEDGITDEKIRHYTEILPEICERSSERERNSDDCARDVDKMKMAEFMEKYIGEEYVGMISGVTNFGLFVQLDNLIEGLINIEDLGDNYYFDKETEILTVGNEKYKLGDKLLVKVLRASKENSEIDFELVERCDKENENTKVKKKV